MSDLAIKNNSSNYILSRVSLGKQIVAGMIAVLTAIALPQMIHMIGKMCGVGSALGEILLPMHLPIMLVGLLAGPFGGAIAGLFAPIFSFILTGMPMIGMLPFITIELVVYGITAGMLKNMNINQFFKVVLIQFAGRVVRGIAILVAVYILGNTAVSATIIFASITKGFPGIIIQLLFIPIVMHIVGKDSKEYDR